MMHDKTDGKLLSWDSGDALEMQQVDDVSAGQKNSTAIYSVYRHTAFTQIIIQSELE